MPVHSPVITEIAKKTYHINEFGLASMYLIVGQSRALLVDTGAGLLDLDTVIRRLTFLPYDVALTHYHPGHSGGMRQFRSLWIHPKDMDKALAVTDEDRARFVRMPRETDDRDVWGDLKMDFPPHPTEGPELLELYDHQRFDLGGREVMVLCTPGHTPGSCSFIDCAGRVAITGDACERHQIVQECAVSTQLRGLFNLYRSLPCFDRIYGGHINYKSVTRTRSAKPIVLLENIAACRCVLEENAARKENRPVYPGKNASITVGLVSMTFHTECVWEAGENHAPVILGE